MGEEGSSFNGGEQTKHVCAQNVTHIPGGIERVTSTVLAGGVHSVFDVCSWVMCVMWWTCIPAHTRRYCALAGGTFCVLTLNQLKAILKR